MTIPYPSSSSSSDAGRLSRFIPGTTGARSRRRLARALAAATLGAAMIGIGPGRAAADNLIVVDPAQLADATVAVQANLDQIAAAGGGTVQLNAGVFNISAPLIVSSNTRLVGAGMGATVLRRVSAGGGKVIQGAEVYATVSTVGAHDVTLENFTIDHATAGVIDNGLSLLPSGQGYSGTPSSNCIVEHVEVLGGGDGHAYMIWNLRGEHIKIRDNFVDGGVPTYVPSSNEEGIESYGGHDVSVTGNTVRNVGHACLNIGSAGLAESDTNALFVVDNYLQGCKRGVDMGPDVAQNNVATHIERNVINQAWETGIYANIVDGAEERDLLVANNTIAMVGSANASGIGIWLQGDPVAAASATTSTSVRIVGNHVSQVLGGNGLGIAVIQYPRVRVADNAVADVSNTGIYVVGSDDVEVEHNVLERIGYGAIVASYSSSLAIASNTVRSWDLNHVGSNAVLVQYAQTAQLNGNRFHALDADPQGLSIYVTATAGAVSLSGNMALYAPRPGVNPFQNDASDASSGRVSITDTNVLTVNNAQVNPTSHVVVTQVSGSPVPFLVQPDNGAFTITIEDVPNAPAVFDWVIMQ